MKNTITALTIAIVLCAMSLQVVAQKSGLRIGQKLPVREVSNTYNYPQKRFRFEQAKGKILVLDFWSTWCGACIRGLAKLDELQKKFPTQLVIVPVNYQSKQIIEKFWQTNPVVKNLKVMTITDDKALTKLFPHQGLPFEVWFDQNGKYLGSTNLEWVNEKEITKLLNGFSPDWVTVTKKVEHNFTKPLIGQDNNKPEAYSTILHYLPSEKDDQIKYNENTKTVGITCINSNILGLYYASLKAHPDLMDAKRLKIEVNDSTRLRYYPSSGYRSIWDKTNRFCYECKWPNNDASLESDYAKMRSDLDLFFKLKSDIKKIKTKCYKLVVDEQYNGILKAGKSFHLNTLATIIGYLNSVGELPIITFDKALDLNKKIDFELSSNNDVNSINKMLQANGYHLITVEEDLDYFILKDR